MQIAILGVGSIGGVLLGALSDTDAELVAIARGESARMLSQFGLVLHTPEGSIETIPAERFVTVDSEAGPLPAGLRGSCDVTLICGKADSTPILAQIAEELLSEDGIAASLQNGMGHAEIIVNRLGRERVLGGTTTHGAWRGEDGVHWVGRGNIRLGRFDGTDAEGTTASLVTKLHEANLDPEWTEDIQRTIWIKILLNVAINPVCAIAGVRNGALLEVPELWEQAYSAMLEAAKVAEASGTDLSEIDLEGTLSKVAGATAQNRCSMLQDVMAGRKTEIDELCGAMVSLGKSLGVETPRNEMLHALVRGIHISSSLE
ncbi:MAG: 2-dehydropantoate 2-reductase [Candidatus Thermoplasmatota archaeon]|nr:2-dehydropantoate 2-reductase [Candidatus Thermoplasmatota archaeon]